MQKKIWKQSVLSIKDDSAYAIAHLRKITLSIYLKVGNRMGLLKAGIGALAVY
ncbi:hypothetical protein LSPH24S_02792 [Lysinibacillus sphaericus]